MAVKAFSVLVLLSVLLILSPVFARDLAEKQDAKTDQPAQDQVDPNGLAAEKQYGYGPRPGYGYGYGRPGYGYGYGRPGYGYGYGRPGYGYGYGRPGYGYGYGCRFRCGYHCCSAKEFAEFMEAENLPEN